MSSTLYLRPWIAAVLFSSTLLWPPVWAYGQSFRWSTRFDTSNSVVVPFSMGSPPASFVLWDGTADAFADPASGSVKIGGQFTGADNEALWAPLTLL